LYGITIRVNAQENNNLICYLPEIILPSNPIASITPYVWLLNE